MWLAHSLWFMASQGRKMPPQIAEVAP